jgi:dihydrolipoamide dehydrogenase
VVRRVADGVVVHLTDGRTVEGSHALMTVGSVPNTADIGLDRVGIALDRGGFIPVDRVSRTRVPGVYAAGDCTGLLLLASVAAMQGRVAMWHALGEGVSPIKLKTVAAAVFTRPEVATVGISQQAIDAGEVPARTIMLPLATNPRSKMQGLRRGFVKLFCRPATGVIIGGVVVAPVASELILPIAMAVQNNLTVNDLAHTFSVYPSLSGSITESGRQLMRHDDLG